MGEAIGFGCIAGSAVAVGGDLSWSNPWLQKLTLGMLNITALLWKELELECEVEGI